jgi:hypothetical protein
MSSEPLNDAVVLSWVDEVSAAWGAAGIDPVTRQRLRVELEDDLAEALASGATAATLTSTHPVEFAEQLAAAHEVAARPRRVLATWSVTAVMAPRRVTSARLVTTSLGSAVLGGVFALYVAFSVDGLGPNGDGDNWPFLRGLPEVAVVLTVYLLAAVTILAFVAGGVALVFRGDPTLRSSVVSAVAGLAAGGAAAVPPTVVFASVVGYSDAAPIVLFEVALVLAFLIAGVLTAKRLAERAGPRRSTVSATPS